MLKRAFFFSFFYKKAELNSNLARYADDLYISLASNTFSKKLFVVEQASTPLWLRCLSMKITWQYGYSGFNLSIRGEGKTSAAIDYTQILGRVKLQNPMTSNPSTALISQSWYNFDVTNNIRLYCIENSTTLKHYELWIHLPDSYGTYLIEFHDIFDCEVIMTTMDSPPETDYLSCSKGSVLNYMYSIGSSQPVGPSFWFNNGNRV